MNLSSNSHINIGLMVNGKNKPLNRSFCMNLELNSEDVDLSFGDAYINEVLSDEINKLVNNVERRLSGV